MFVVIAIVKGQMKAMYSPSPFNLPISGMSKILGGSIYIIHTVCISTFTSKAGVFASLLVAGEKTEPRYAIENKFLAHEVCSLCSRVLADAL